MSRKPEEFKDGYLESQPISLYPEYTDFASELRNQLVRIGCLTSQELLKTDYVFSPQMSLRQNTVQSLQDMGLDVSGKAFPLIIVCSPALRDEKRYLVISAKEKGGTDRLSLGVANVVSSLWDLDSIEIPFPKRCPKTRLIYIDGTQFQGDSIVKVEARDLFLGPLPNGLQDKGREGILLVAVNERNYDGVARQWKEGAVQITSLAVPQRWRGLFQEGKLREPSPPLDQVLAPEELARLITLAPKTAFAYLRERVEKGTGDRQGENAAFPLYEGPVRVESGTRKAILEKKETSVRILVLPDNTIRLTLLSLDLESLKSYCYHPTAPPPASLVLECFSRWVDKNRAGQLILKVGPKGNTLQIEVKIEKWDGVSEFVELKPLSLFATEYVGNPTGLAILFSQLKPPLPIPKLRMQTQYFG